MFISWGGRERGVWSGCWMVFECLIDYQKDDLNIRETVNLLLLALINVLMYGKYGKLYGGTYILYGSVG